ncbi:NADP-specific glutamate dehydrogenase [Allofrancisella guangzhouensis]|uniref:Glutamate dehydrogenase n=1 Tax=Allofrancisella guangzhouensis TaxID=594679 RepID=A0A0A8E657_9GAMM|nr:NADP-specific glutamate dehydrogenase [Allofrancisella guangzhouensis]AJC49454.1 glutamate dehydrogenase [Allofrancisella guangzhouensis]MBK2026749.1 NADP-specific glutamate dehydrogenase [Allofrancisella guangzhouensis]MBK2044254.1 NADP-specific glutamate dehydrogenase [Allofrancisella guangzhouensis]MBK2046171.1 NADP-specific glutamate dehydrogenase [Allofrancisella guangzhouensis]
MQAQEYIEKIIAEVEKKDSHEKEFIQAVKEVLHTLKPALEKNPKYIEENVLGRIVEPERGITFRVPWVDRNGNVQVNRGYRYQFNGAIGPYKGGIRFHPSVYSGIIKFLGFEQIFKNSLTTLPLGGGKGGSDFDPKDKTDTEIMNFCQSFMTELQRHIGPDIDVPAGDIGVGGKEIGYMYGQYRRIRGAFENGVLTGKSLESGGSLIRPEATGYGAVFFLEEMLKHDGASLKGKTVVVSGYGNVSWGVCKKLDQLGAKAVTISGSKGFVHDPAGIIGHEKIEFLLKIREGKATMQDYAGKFGATFHAGQKPWGINADIAIPCATQNEIDVEDAEKLIQSGVKYVVEASNMPTTNEAIEYLMNKGVVLAPGKAANAGGVATSGLEMCQNSARISWTAEEVETKLQQIMANIFEACRIASEKYDLGYNLVAGANLAGFEKIAEAMIQQGRY